VKRKGIGDVGVVIWSAAKECIAGTALVLSDSGRSMGYPAAGVAGFFGVTTSAVIRTAYSERIHEIETYL